jgi:hypothetical protein
LGGLQPTGREAERARDLACGSRGAMFATDRVLSVYVHI